MRTNDRMLISMLMLSVLSVVFAGGCSPLSETVEDPAVGLNGGFEIVRNGLPVNWPMYTPNTVPDAVFQIVMDNEIYKEGRQSLRFDVAKCSARGGGWRSPGFTNEFFENGKGRFGEGRYRISCWVRNEDSLFALNAGAVASLKGDMKPLITSDEKIGDWRLLEYEVDVPKDSWLRMQLNILKPGTFWIDDIRIQRIDEDAG